MKLSFVSAALVAAVLSATSADTFAQTTTAPTTFGEAKELPLYPGVAPGSVKWDYSEVVIQGKSGPQLKNVVRPALLYFPAANPTGTAMVVAPGGGADHFMDRVAEWMRVNGWLAKEK